MNKYKLTVYSNYHKINRKKILFIFFTLYLEEYFIFIYNLQ